MNDMDSRMIKKILERIHADDVFFTEVTIGQGARRMDAWAMKKSWANPLVTGYEIKVSRGDFLHDDKLQEYMPYCNKMYVVCPRGVVKDGELPENVGLMLVNSTKDGFMIGKKAPFREVQLPENFLRSILFAKASKSEDALSFSDREILRRMEQVSVYKDFVEGRKELKDLGYMVSKKITSRMFKYERDAATDKALVESYKEWKDFSQKAYDIFGYSFARLVSTGQQDVALEKIHEILDKLSNPEKILLGKIESFSFEMEKFKSILIQQEGHDGKETPG